MLAKMEICQVLPVLRTVAKSNSLFILTRDIFLQQLICKCHLRPWILQTLPAIPHFILGCLHYRVEETIIQLPVKTRYHSFKPLFSSSSVLSLQNSLEERAELEIPLMCGYPGKEAPGTRTSFWYWSRVLWVSWAQSLSMSPISLITEYSLHSASMTFAEFQGYILKLLVEKWENATLGRNSQEKQVIQPWGTVLVPHPQIHTISWAGFQILKLPSKREKLTVNDGMLTTSMETQTQLNLNVCDAKYLYLPSTYRKNTHELIMPSWTIIINFLSSKWGSLQVFFLRQESTVSPCLAK